MGSATGVKHDISNLSRYCNDVYDREIRFKLEKSTEKALKNSLETLVFEIGRRLQKGICDETVCRLPRLKRVSLCEISDPIVKVGSYYEGTKVGFPDEFDFIFILATYQVKKKFRIKQTDLNNHGLFPTWADYRSFHHGFKRVLQAVIECGLINPNINGSLRVTDFLDEHGPAFKLKFVYEKEFGKDREIYVDFVPAFKFIGVGEDHFTLPHKVDDLFLQDCLEKSSFLVVDRKLSFTEAEVHLMRNVVSENHRRAYTILKFLTGGHGDAERVRIKRHQIGLSSYKLKTLVILHHYECSRDTDIGNCVLLLLEKILDTWTTGNFPSLVGIAFPFQYDRSYVDELQYMTRDLRAIGFQKSYRYEDVKIRPLATKWLERHLSENSPQQFGWSCAIT